MVFIQEIIYLKLRKGQYAYDGANLDECKSIGTHWIALYVNGNNIYFESFGVDHVPKEIKKFIGNKIITNIYKIQAYNLMDTSVLDLLILS